MIPKDSQTASEMCYYQEERKDKRKGEVRPNTASLTQAQNMPTEHSQKNWSGKCATAEFAISSSVNATTGYAPFELDHRYMPRSGQHISINTLFRGVKQLTQQRLWNLLDAHNVILEHRVEQTYYSNKHQNPNVQYQLNDLVYLSTKNLTLPKGRARKLMPRFIGPYKILKLMNDSLNITIELPQELKDRRISPTFHTNLVQPYVENDNVLFPKQEAKTYYNFGNNDKQEWFIEEILAHKWTNSDLELQVKWMLGDITWEPMSSCKDLEALDKYLELWGVKCA